MPIHHYVHPTDRVVICFGDISFDHVLESLQALGGDPSFKPGFRQLVDLWQVSKLRLRLKDLQEIQHSWDPFSNTGKRAVFAIQLPIFRLAKTYQSLVARTEFRVFHTLTEAISWLNLQASPLKGCTRRSSTARVFSTSTAATMLEMPTLVPKNFPVARKRT